MYTYLDFKCWEITKCKNISCAARHNPDIPCWEIARKDDAYNNASNTCKDCMVYLLKADVSEIGLRLMQQIMQQRVRLEKSGTGHQICL